MEKFSLEIDDRTAEEKKEDKKRQRQAAKNDKPLMDTHLHEDVGEVRPQIRIRAGFSDEIQGKKHEPNQQERFDFERIADAVSSGDVSRLEGLEEYLRKYNKTLTSMDYCHKGKTVLMKALLNLKNGEIVERLLSIAERNNNLLELVNTARTDDCYKGQTALHIAIERRNKALVNLLIQKGANVHAQACGTFFQPVGENCFYFGELPLSLAACTNQKDIVDLLMEKADVKRTDTLGNTVLHALVMVADNSAENTKFVISMYDYILTKDAVKNSSPKKLEDIENSQGLTPIKLAAKLGKIRLLEHILNREFQEEECRHLSRRFTEWGYGPVSGALYDLNSIDTCDPKSVLEIIIYGPEIPNRLEMLQIELLSKLLEDKWDRFAKWIFLFKFIAYTIYLTFFTAVSYHRQDGTPPFPIRKGGLGSLLLLGQIVMVTGSFYFICIAVVDLYKKRPGLQTLLIDGYCDLLFLLQGVLFIVCAVLYFAGKKEYLTFLVFSVALCWVNLLYFSRGSRHMGIYNIMIQRIFLSDIFRFLYVYLVFLIGFSAAVVILLKDPDNGSSSNTGNQNETKTYKSITLTTLELFKFTIGMGDLEFTEDYEYKDVFYVLLILYLVLTYILLFNMLIALMSKTVDDMSDESASIWKLQRAITILDIERFAWFMKARLRSGVKKDLGKKKDEDCRWCFRVQDVDWENWNRNLCIISEDPGNYQTVLQTESDIEPDASRHRFIRHTSKEGPETEPLASSQV
ncbi:transient receptor potential cation channel subfamily V member 1-like [Clarias gariepinus]